jgi:hypothetical protein
MDERDAWFDRMRARFRLEHGLLLGAVIMLLGLVLMGVIVAVWIDRGFGVLSEERLAVLAAALFIIGVQVFFSSFLLSILGLRRNAGGVSEVANAGGAGGVAHSDSGKLERIE